jgi:hypothetical protein
MRLAGGSGRLSASTGTRVRGTRTPATAISAGFSLSRRRIEVSAAVRMAVRIWTRPGSSSIARGWCGVVTAGRGSSGGPLERAGSVDSETPALTYDELLRRGRVRDYYERRMADPVMAARWRAQKRQWHREHRAKRPIVVRVAP